MDVVWKFFESHSLAGDLALGGAVLVVAWLSYLAARIILVRVMHRVTARTRAGWDDALMNQKVFHRLALFVPAVAGYYGADLFPELTLGIKRALLVYLITVTVLVANAVLSAGAEVYQQTAMSQRRPIKGIVQLVKLFVFILAGVAGVAVALGQSPWALLSGLGALSAIILLVFRDTILSFVAGLTLSGGDLLRKGDWLEMTSFGADGEVIDIALHTVRVQNWDKTIVSIPTYKLTENSFKNWRGMSEAGARRVKRSLIIDQASVGFVDDGLMASLGKIQLLKPYLEERRAQIEAANQASGADPSHPVNGRRMTNLGCFRAYAEAYLAAHPTIRHDLTRMVRQLAPTDEGLPLEVYCFISDTVWTRYESIQADIFDHLLAAMPWFRLRVYQRNQFLDPRVPRELLSGSPGSPGNQED